MSRNFETGPSYFDLPKRRHEPSGSSEKTSPLTASGSSSTNWVRVRPIRPSLLEEHRSHSDSPLTRSWPRFQTIKEEIAGHQSESDTFDRRESPKDHTSKPETANSSRSSSRVSARRLIELEAHRNFPPNKASLEVQVRKEDHNEQKIRFWSRSQSGYFSKRYSGGDRESSVTPQAESPLGTVQSSPIQPLRPPPTKLPRSYSNPNIRIEKTFTVFEQGETDNMPSEQRFPKPQTPILIHTKHMIRNSIGIFHRRYRGGSQASAEACGLDLKRTKGSAADYCDHQTNLRKGVAAAGLKRVSCILQDVESPGARERTASANTSQTLCLQSQYSKPLEESGSTDSQTADTDSTIRRLHMGVTPFNTPEEKATYTTADKNGNITEHLKIDISIRGQTSYLPSEARRIHTPPTPSQGLDGRARGFFFDYNAPEHSQQQAVSDARDSSKLRDRGSSRSCESRGSAASHVPTISRGFVPRDFKHVARVQADDQYGIQLAGLNTCPSEGEETDQSPRSELSESALLRVLNPEEFDQTIPEHLPTSPLCPRHPRYWRIIKNKGSQFRGCWMHGLGEFSVDEKAKYGIKQQWGIRHQSDY